MTLKQLIWKLILPLTIVSFTTFTKWWYVLPVDAPDTMMIGFPFAFVADGWFTSMSLQIFLVEFTIDLAIYFLFWFILTFMIRHFSGKKNISKVLTRTVCTLAILTTLFWSAIFIITEKHMALTRTWDMQVLTTGFKITYTPMERPDITKYAPKKN